MAPNPYFTNTFATYIEVNGKKYYLNSSRVTLKPDDKIKLKNLLCCNGGDKGDILVAVYAYDGTNFHQVAGGSKTLNPDACMTESDLDKNEFYARELCMFNKDIEIVVISFYWDGSSWKQDDWLCYDSNCGFKVKVETKCCDWLCTSHAKLFKVKVVDEYGNPIENATVEICFDCAGTCKTSSPGYESFTTDSNGEVWIEKCAPGIFDPSCVSIVVSKSGYVSKSTYKNYSDISDCETFNFTLQEVSLVTIIITVQSDTTPIEDAEVKLYESGGTLVSTKYTDSYGQVEFKDLDAFKYYYVEITKDCYKKYTSPQFLPANKTFKITSYKFCFKVEVQDEQGYPLENATVELYDDKENFIASDTTDSSGLTDFFVTDKDPVIVKVTKSGYTEHKGTIYSTELGLGDTLTVTLYKEGKGDIEVTVEDVGGNPIKAFDVYYKEKTSDAWRHGCSVFDGETNKCTIKDVPFGTYDIKASNVDYGDATANITHYSSKTTVTITLGAPTGKASVKFRVYSREGGALIYTLTPLENVSVTLECKDINYSKTLKTNKDGEADFGEIDLQNTKRTFHYKIYYNEYWQTYEADRTFTQGYSYDIEIHLERCSELIPGWQRMIMSWLGIETENLTCDEAESLGQQFTTYFLIGAAIFLFLFLLSLLK